MTIFSNIFFSGNAATKRRALQVMALMLFLGLLLPSILPAQELLMVDSSRNKASFRGISMPSNEVVWVSGSEGTVGKSEDGGLTWKWVNPVGYEKRDFRDIEAFDAQTAIVMAVDNPAVILRTTNGGQTWKQVFYREQEGMFLDAMDFSGKKGMAIGDPVDGRFYMIYTRNKGKKWKEVNLSNRPVPDSGDAIFAASGSNIVLNDSKTGQLGAFISGGRQNKLWLLGGTVRRPKTERVIKIPLMQGKETTGLNGLAIMHNIFFMAGGDFADPLRPDSNFFALTDRGARPRILPSIEGYKSGITVGQNFRLIACGTSGIAFGVSRVDEKENRHFGFRDFSRLPFHTVVAAPNAPFAILAGPRGRIARLNW